jgi:hypothetical protein
LAVIAADRAVEGRAYAREISSGYPGSSDDKTDKKIDSFDGGPAGCLKWADAYGQDGPCVTCEFRGKIKNPAVQLGGIADTTLPGVQEGEPTELVPPWVAEMNQRFALVRHGSGIVIADFQTPIMTGRGVVRSMGMLATSSLRQMFNGRFVPTTKADEKPTKLADAWLSHVQRRQYEGLVYAPPPEETPPEILNLWQGFAVEPVAGEVEPWLAVLVALVPDESDRSYVLRWIAWKIQNPGGVPDTVLIFKGAKGTGKNSLFDPLILLFGKHAMLAADPELIAGRFTWHLMDLSFAVLDEAVFVGDPRQSDRIKSRVTGKVMTYEQKGMDPVQGVNRCAYVMLTNHEYVWNSTKDERRAVVQEVGESLRGNLDFWVGYHRWVNGVGPAALLHYLQNIDLTGFNPRQIPKGEALRQQVELTALREPAVAWWHQCLSEGTIRWRLGGDDLKLHLNDDTDTEVNSMTLRLSFEQSAAARGRNTAEWAAVSRRLHGWVGPDGIRKVRARTGVGVRERFDVLPPLTTLRKEFSAATQVRVSP